MMTPERLQQLKDDPAAAQLAASELVSEVIALRARLARIEHAAERLDLITQAFHAFPGDSTARGVERAHSALMATITTTEPAS